MLLQPLEMSRRQYQEIFTRDEIVLLIYYDPIPVSYHENLTFLPSMFKQHRNVSYLLHTGAYEINSSIPSIQRVRKSLLLQKGYPISRQGPRLGSLAVCFHCHPWNILMRDERIYLKPTRR